MDRKHNIPNDLAECQRLLLAAFKQTVQLEQQAAVSQQRIAQSEQRAAELDRVLDATSASFQELREKHASTIEELAWYKRWVHGRRRERIVEGEGQQHLFDLALPEEPKVPALSEEPHQQIAGHTRRRRRELDLSRLPHHRHELDLSPKEKICSCCGRAKDCIGEDVTTILEHVPSKLEMHEHVRPKYACRYCKNGVSSPPPPERPIARASPVPD